MSKFDQEKAQAFAGKMMDALNGGMLGLMLGIGHRTDLFDVLTALEPSTSQQIADAAGLHERYVREWLDTMVVSRVVDYIPESERYHLPAEHAAALNTQAGANNIARFARSLGYLGRIEEDVAECFRKGGGVSYAAFSDYMKLWSGITAEMHCPRLVEKVIPLLPGGANALEKGIDVLEVGCGYGAVSSTLAATFPESRFTGYDLLNESVKAARKTVSEKQLTNIHFESRDVSKLKKEAAFDLIIAFDCIHDMAHPAAALSAINSALRPGGTFLMVDIAASSHTHENIDHPFAPWLYTTSCLHCMTVSLAEGGEGLGTAWGKQTATELLKQAGFSNVQIHQIDGDFFNNYFVATS